MPPVTPREIPPDFVGSRRDGEQTRFRVWAPDHHRLDVVLYKKDARQPLASFPMTRAADGYHEACFEGPSRLLYKYLVDGQGPYPDPASRAQPFGVHGPSEAADEGHVWSDAAWHGVPVEDLVIYEAHVGAATSAGTFDALAARLADIRELGATAVELMPVASFPGRRNWGYDGVSLYAAHAGYGGAAGLRRFVDAAHKCGLAVLLDVVYNHLGPDGNYLRCFATQYFTARHHTPWGDAVDFAHPAVRAFFLQDVEMWIRDYHLDGLRLDATHAILDDTEPHILRVIGDRARAAAPERKVLVIAEDERNERRLVTSPSKGGYQLDAVWADDFHHVVRRALAGDADGWYRDYAGTAEELCNIIQKGWLYEGHYSAHRDAPRGTRAGGIEPARFIHCIQNHDQIGNRAQGDRLGARVSAAAYRAASALLLLSPSTPLLFMGQEWNASTPFLYFTDHHAELGRAVREGRRAEFAAFASFAGPIHPISQSGQSGQSGYVAPGVIPDPQSSQTFEDSILRWEERDKDDHAGVLRLYKDLLRLRRSHPALQSRLRDSSDTIATPIGADTLTVRRRCGSAELLLVVSLGSPLRHRPDGDYRMLLHTEHARYGGSKREDEANGDRGIHLEGAGCVILEALR